MTNNPYDGQPPMGGGPGAPTGPQGQPYGSTPGGSNPSNGKSPLGRVLSADSDLPASVRQVQLATLVSAVAAIVLGIISAITNSVVLSSEFQAAGFESSLVTGGTVFGTIIGVVLTAGLYVLVLIPLLGGKNWGRILGIVFAILGGLSGRLVFSPRSGCLALAPRWASYRSSATSYMLELRFGSSYLCSALR